MEGVLSAATVQSENTPDPVAYSTLLMKAKNREKMFDERKDIMPHLALSKAHRPRHEQRRVNVDFPAWIIESLDAQASRLSVTRQSVIKLWIAERLKEEQKKAS